MTDPGQKMRTTPEGIRNAREALANGCIEFSADWFTGLLDDFDALLAEVAALRRVESEDAWVDRSPGCGWQVTTSECRGEGPTLAAALADYDAKKAGG